MWAQLIMLQNIYINAKEVHVQLFIITGTAIMNGSICFSKNQWEYENGHENMNGKGKKCCGYPVKQWDTWCLYKQLKLWETHGVCINSSNWDTWCLHKQLKRWDTWCLHKQLKWWDTWCLHTHYSIRAQTMNEKGHGFMKQQCQSWLYWQRVYN